MCIKHHTHCSVESVLVEQGTRPPSLSSVCGRGRQVVETRTSHVSAQVVTDRGPLRDGLKMLQWNLHCVTVQYMIYNMKRTVRKLASSREKTNHVEGALTNPSTNQLCGPRRRFVTGTNKWPSVCTVKNTNLKPSCHHTGNTDQVFHTPNTTRRLSTQWTRTTWSPQSGDQPFYSSILPCTWSYGIIPVNQKMGG
jgi:hypothetical protein